MELRIEHVKVELQKEEIIRDISLEIKRGEFVSLLGVSGCGKTTLLKSIAGLLEIESGSILLEGRPIEHLPPEKRGTVIVFQDLRLFPHMTVEQNIAFSMEIKKKSKKHQQEVVKELLEEVKLSGFEKRRIREMSGGQLQRVALARALAADPAILLLDEPFSGLDERLRMEMGTLVSKLQRERKITTILVTHDKKEALQMSDRIALMDAGEILQYDTPWQIFCQPASRAVAEYFGEANYIEGQVEQEKFTCKAGTFEIPGYSDGRYEMIVRPFALKVSPGKSEIFVEDVIFQGETAQLSLRQGENRYLSAMLSAKAEEMGIGKGTQVKMHVDTGRSACLLKLPVQD